MWSSRTTATMKSPYSSPDEAPIVDRGTGTQRHRGVPHEPRGGCLKRAVTADGPQSWSNRVVPFGRRRSLTTIEGVGLRVGDEMHRRDALKTLVALFARVPARAQRPSVSTLIGTGSAGYSDQQVNNPYGLAIGPDGALYFCDLDNQRIRRLDLKTRQTLTVAGNGQKGYSGDGAAATDASLNMPHEIQFDSVGHLYIAERDNHVVRKVDAVTGVISTFAGTGSPGFSGDGGPASSAQLRQPHSIAVDPAQRFLLICDIGNHRIRRVELATGHIETFAGTGDRQSTPDGTPLKVASQRPQDNRLRFCWRAIPRTTRGQRDLPRGWQLPAISASGRDRGAGTFGRWGSSSPGKAGWTKRLGMVARCAVRG
jgi:hypothetical protein